MALRTCEILGVVNLTGADPDTVRELLREDDLHYSHSAQRGFGWFSARRRRQHQAEDGIGQAEDPLPIGEAEAQS